MVTNRVVPEPQQPITAQRVGPLMSDRAPEDILKMRALAAQMRAYAAETCQEDFRRKFEAVAEDLERRAEIEVQSFLPSRLDFGPTRSPRH